MMDGGADDASVLECRGARESGGEGGRATVMRERRGDGRLEKSTPALRMRPLASHRVYETSNAPIRGALAENFPASVGAARWRVGRSWVPNDVSWLTDSACKSTLRSVQDDDEANSASVALSVSSAMSYASLEPLRWKVGRAATQRSKCTATFITIWRGLRSRSGRTAWPLPSRSGAQRTRGGLKSRDAVEVSGRLEAGQKSHFCVLICVLCSMHL